MTTVEAMKVNALIRAGAIGEALTKPGFKLPQLDLDELARRISEHVETHKAEPTDDELRAMLRTLPIP